MRALMRVLRAVSHRPAPGTAPYDTDSHLRTWHGDCGKRVPRPES